jgi:hypothetical protein
MQSFSEDIAKSHTFSNKVIYEVKIFIDVLYNMTVCFYQKEVQQDDFDSIYEDVHKLLTHLTMEEEIHFILLVLARI